MALIDVLDNMKATLVAQSTLPVHRVIRGGGIGPQLGFPAVSIMPQVEDIESIRTRDDNPFQETTTVWWRHYHRRLDTEECFRELMALVEVSRGLLKSDGYRTWGGNCIDSYPQQIVYDIEPTGEDELLYGAFIRIAVVLES